MAAKDNEVVQPIIVKKVKKGGHGHHGGAWKVAYADFVTAMMAFFLLMWLLNVTTKEQKNAISHYFDPTHPIVSDSVSGSGGVLGGMTMSPDGAQVSNVQNLAVPPTPCPPESGRAMGQQRDQMGTSKFEGDTFDPIIDGNKASDTDQTADVNIDGNNNQDGLNILDTLQDLEQAEIEQLEAIVEAAQNEDFEAIKQKILEEVSKSPELADLLEHLMVDITPEGLRIQIIDKEGRSMFPIGKASMFPFMKQLVEKVTQVLIPQPNQISVRGHTDGKPYPPGATYNNWNLSSDRAIASQRAILDSGLSVERVQNVVGKADREHLLPDDPLSPRNRRISVILLREELENTDEIRQAAADALKKKEEKIKAESEDREDIPELDRVINKTPDFELENNVKEQTKIEKSTDPVGNEIRKLQEENKRRQAPPLSAPIQQPNVNNDAQVLEFP